MKRRRNRISPHKNTLQKARTLAARRNQYARAMQRQFAMMQREAQSNETNAYTWTRDELHERN